VGPFYGLSLELDVESLYYLRRGLTEHTGIIGIVHDPKKVPVISVPTFQVNI
jgi:hypothetical protein